MLAILVFTTSLFLLACFGVFLSRQHIIIMLISLELMLIAIVINFVCFSVFYDDFLGQIYGFLILSIAAAESSLGLALLVIYFRLRGGIAVSLLTLLKS